MIKDLLANAGGARDTDSIPGYISIYVYIRLFNIMSQIPKAVLILLQFSLTVNQKRVI